MSDIAKPRELCKIQAQWENKQTMTSHQFASTSLLVEYQLSISQKSYIVIEFTFHQNALIRLTYNQELYYFLYEECSVL